MCEMRRPQMPWVGFILLHTLFLQIAFSVNIPLPITQYNAQAQHDIHDLWKPYVYIDNATFSGYPHLRRDASIHSPAIYRTHTWYRQSDNPNAFTFAHTEEQQQHNYIAISYDSD